MPLHFAYGSNMNREAMAGRCPQSKALGLARLPRHRLVIMREGYANVVRDPRQTVYGVLWDIALADMRALDHYEGVSQGLYRKVMQPVLREGGGSARALVYMSKSAAGGHPKAGYMQGLLAAAQDWGLPEAYLCQLQMLGAGSRLSAIKSASVDGSNDSDRVDGPVKGVRARYSSPLGPRD